MDSVRTLYPNASKQDLATLLTLTVSSLLSIVASRERISSLPHEEIPATPLDYRTVLVDYCTGGIERALVEPEVYQPTEQCPDQANLRRAAAIDAGSALSSGV